MIKKDTIFGVVGLGVLGGSYCQALSKQGFYCIGIDIDPYSIFYAKENGWIKEGSTDPSLVKKADIVVAALYPHVFEEWLIENGKFLKSGCLLTDVTGVKRKVNTMIRNVLPEEIEFVSCHPMAGREMRGIQYADSSRFQNANFIIVPDASNTESALSTVETMAALLGFKKISFLSAQEHDRMIGFLSQLTHVIAVTLMNSSDNTHLVDYTGDSFRNLTRIAKINEDMWAELFLLNKDNLLDEIDLFAKELQSFRNLLENEDVQGMKEKMILSTTRRKKFD